MPKCLTFWLPDGFPKHEVWKHQGQAAGRTSWQWGREGLEYPAKSPVSGTGDWSSHFNSSYCMTLIQPSPWLSLTFPHVDSEVAGPVDSQGPTSSDTLHSRAKETTDISKERPLTLLWLKHQG